ncbi:MAG: hypothetical protein H6737_18115 [Alphaproteobacteria bacterium]|nr:hypothetical protein [Alphaproteobacteria bacterium]
MIALLAMLACKTAPPGDTDVEPAVPTSCDAGDEAWVQRAIPLLWGRKAHGSAEVRAWVSMTQQHGREAVVRAMAQGPEYRQWWRQWVTDALAVARTGDKAYSRCFMTPLRETHDGSLVQYIRSVDEPWEATTPSDGAFNMADVVLDAIEADDLAVAWQVNLYSRMNRPVQGANVSEEELEYNRRVNFGETFFETYLNRNLDCVLCHNSQFSTTDDPDARLDRTWQLPGNHETAILGSNVAFSKDEAFSMFRTAGVLRYQSGRRPFGMDEECGRFTRPTNIDGPDYLGQDTTYLVDAYGPEGSVWQLERNLAEGADRLAITGLSIGETGAVQGEDSFAYLLGARIADLVFEEATGGRLTIAHGFPRNLQQASRLEALTDTLVESGFSLRELLVAVTADELFNADLPEVCETVAYGLDPVVNPWSVEDDDTAKRHNSPGDLAHRHSARVLTFAANDHLGWEAPRGWQLPEGEEEFQAAIGTWLRESQPGFRGTDFQGLLAYQDRYATCDGGQPDFIASLRGQSAGHTVGDVVYTLKDRLLANGAISDAERPLVEALVGPLDAPAEDVDGQGLRALCGAILTSPAYMVALAPTGIGDPPPIADRSTEECDIAKTAMQAAGFTVSSCELR